MQCTCGGETRVLESRKTADGLKRRRKCLTCESRFSTIEKIVCAPKIIAPILKPAKEIKPIKSKTKDRKLAKVATRRLVEDLEYDNLDIGSRYRW